VAGDPLAAVLGRLVGLGSHTDVASAAARMVRTAEIRDPDPAVHGRYDDLYRSVYRPMYGRLRPLYRELRRIFS
jgi:hypothetical protein